MDLNFLQEFFFWCLMINLVVYMITALAIVFLRSFIYRVHGKLLGLEEKESSTLICNYLANYKLLITVFVFVPWIALIIMR